MYSVQLYMLTAWYYPYKTSCLVSFDDGMNIH